MSNTTQAATLLQKLLDERNNNPAIVYTVADTENQLEVRISGLDLDPALRRSIVDHVQQDMPEPPKAWDTTPSYSAPRESRAERFVGKGIIDKKLTTVPPEKQVTPDGSGAINRAMNIVSEDFLLSAGTNNIALDVKDDPKNIGKAIVTLRVKGERLRDVAGIEAYLANKGAGSQTGGAVR